MKQDQILRDEIKNKSQSTKEPKINKGQSKEYEL